MLVKVNTSLAGANFAFRFGEEVEQDVFAALVGNGWESLCDKVVETADKDAPADTAVADTVVETADVAPATERRGRRK